MYTTCIHCEEFFALDTGVVHRCPDSIPRMTPDETVVNEDQAVMSIKPKDIIEDDITDAIVWKYRLRAEAGMVKYGVALEGNPKGLMFWLRNLQEELMDATVYIERTMQELRKMLKDE